MPIQAKKQKKIRSDLLKRFCQEVTKVPNTSDLISIVAADAEHMRFCRYIVSPDKHFQATFNTFCKRNKFDAQGIRTRLRLVATVLGVGQHTDYYDILGVSSEADIRAIREAYRKKAKLYHPDTLNGKNVKNDQFVEIHAAYVHLSDPSLRTQYDQARKSYKAWVEGGHAVDLSLSRPRTGRLIGWASVLFVAAVIVTIALIDYSQTPKTRLWEDETESEKGDNPEFPLSSANPMFNKSDEDNILMFYNPRRSKRYWATEDSKHDSLGEAIDSLARIYKRTPSWILTHMGQENDLQMIHRSLAEQDEVEARVSKIRKPDDTLFAGNGQEIATVGEAQPTIVSETQPTEETIVQSDPGAENKDVDEAGKKIEAIEPVKEYKPVKEVEPKKEVVIAKAPVLESEQKKKPAGNDKKSAPQKQEPPPPEKVSDIAVAEPRVVTPKKPKEVVSKKKVIKKEPATSKIDKQQILSFLKNYTKTYEKRDLLEFKKFFTDSAIEQGKPFEELLPTYQQTFESVEALEYRINLKSYSEDADANTILVEGDFIARYRLPERDWGQRSGSIRMELLNAPGGLMVKRMDYNLQQ